ncbi:MAG: hypothetical protein JXD23_10945 [Spirochaetales bacterium]|nr:hypothetical protein [Spirochaetales bacterium]
MEKTGFALGERIKNDLNLNLMRGELDNPLRGKWSIGATLISLFFLNRDVRAAAGAAP